MVMVVGILLFLSFGPHEQQARPFLVDYLGKDLYRSARASTAMVGRRNLFRPG